ncbi:hypothetical protein C8Q74DRAFT_1218649 [Fomes fomentarius]|nr:hypothetical protein C8Q74DRAFT_1218649 [Fomes fomentarius]
MDRQGRDPPQRQSSLPPSLQRLMVPGPSQPPSSTAQEEGASPEIDEELWRPPRAGPSHPIPSRPTDQQLPSTILTEAIFGEAAQSREDATYTVPPPGPPLPPISWSPAQAAGGSAFVPSPVSIDRREFLLAEDFSQQSSPRRVSPSPPVAGPSRLPEEPPSRRRKPRAKKSQQAIPTQEAGLSSGNAPTSRRPHGVDHTTRDNYAVAVGSTAYHVTTLLPLRATLLSPAAEPGPSAPSSASVSDSPGIAAERAPSQAASVQEVSAESEPVSTALTTGKRRRRTRAEKGKESASSSSSEHAHAPKSKKTLIACHFCRARKLRCDGQKPSCANCRKRSHPCTYEQQPKRRGPGKTPRGSSRRRGRQATAPAGGGGSGAEAGRAESTSISEVAGPGEAAPASGVSAAFPYTRSAFEPQLTGPVPTYPGLSYRPPSPSSSFSPTAPLRSFSVPRPGPSRSTASESVQSSTTSSAPSVPESEDSAGGVGEGVDYEELEEFYRQPHPGTSDEGGQ